APRRVREQPAGRVGPVPCGAIGRPRTGAGPDRGRRPVRLSDAEPARSEGRRPDRVLRRGGEPRPGGPEGRAVGGATEAGGDGAGAGQLDRRDAAAGGSHPATGAAPARGVQMRIHHGGAEDTEKTMKSEFISFLLFVFSMSSVPRW